MRSGEIRRRFHARIEAELRRVLAATEEILIYTVSALDKDKKDSGKGPRIYPIVLFGDPVLDTPAETVSVFDEKLHILIEDMFASMYSAHGVGLAAPQIGISKRIAVIDCSFKERPEEKYVLINPEIIHTEGKQQGSEGCLSVPEFRENLTRPAKATVRAQDASGKEFKLTGEGLLARAILHETDHLNGKLYISHLSALKRDLMKRKIKKLVKAGEWVYEPPAPM
jgi:peptide deformylase